MSGNPPIVFPTNPTTGQLFTANNTTWQWNGTMWVNANTSANFLPLAGGTINPGPLLMTSNAAQPLAVPTYQQVSRLVATNWVDNATFAINQRGYVNGTALAAGVYGFDRWKAGAAGCTFSVTYTPAAAVFNGVASITAGSLQQVMEAGQVIAQPYTLSWVGTAQGRIANTSGGGTYASSPITFTPSAGTSIFVEFSTGTLTQVQLVLGPIPLPFQPTPFGADVASCERFYQTIGVIFGGYLVANTNGAGWASYVTTMRANPSSSFTGVTVGGVCGGFTVAGANTRLFSVDILVTGPGTWLGGATFSFSADL